jgi:hypothetical protein
VKVKGGERGIISDAWIKLIERYKLGLKLRSPLFPSFPLYKFKEVKNLSIRKYDFRFLIFQFSRIVP